MEGGHSLVADHDRAKKDTLFFLGKCLFVSYKAFQVDLNGFGDTLFRLMECLPLCVATGKFRNGCNKPVMLFSIDDMKVPVCGEKFLHTPPTYQKYSRFATQHPLRFDLRS